MTGLRGKNAILTGASRGIGPVISRALADEGVNQVLAARTPVLLDKTAEEATKRGVRAVTIPIDLRDPSQIRLLAQSAEEQLGPIDILVSNAGVDIISAFAQMSEDEIIGLMQLNTLAPLLLTRHVLPGMLKRGSGHIVIVSSLAGKKGVAYEATYAASKAALNEWSSALAVELEGSGVTLSLVCPGYVSDVGMFADTGMEAPRRAGPVSSDAVAKAVVDVLKTGGRESIVCGAPARPLLAVNALSPRLGNKIHKMLGVTQMHRQIAARRQPPAVE